MLVIIRLLQIICINDKLLQPLNTSIAKVAQFFYHFAIYQLFINFEKNVL